MDGVSRQNQGNYNYPVGYGYITIPQGVDRDTYIQTCYRKERVAIQLDNGGSVINNCYISRSSIQQLIFPDKPDEIGSCVVFVSPKFNNLPIIVGVVSKADETQLLEEKSFKKVVSTDNTNVSIEGKGKSGELFINVESGFENEGSIYITLKSKNNTSRFNLKCFGDINIYAEGETTLKTLKGVDIQKIRIENNDQIISSEIILDDDGFEIRDSNNNTISSNTDGEINIQPGSKCKIFDGGSPLVKGDELLTQLNVMKSRINSIISVLETAQSSSTTAATYAAAITAGLQLITQVESFDKINSDKTFTD